MTAPQPHTASLPCGKVFYTKSGSGPDMILLHGWGCDNTTLESVRRTAALTHTVYNLDFPGFGSSPEPEGIWSVFDYADMLGQFIAATGIKRPVLLGHSFGGRVSIIYASAHHDVDKVVLVDSAGVRNPLPLRKRLKVAAFKAAKKNSARYIGQNKGSRIHRPLARHGRLRRLSCRLAQDASHHVESHSTRPAPSHAGNQSPHIIDMGRARRRHTAGRRSQNGSAHTRLRPRSAPRRPLFFPPLPCPICSRALIIPRLLTHISAAQNPVFKPQLHFLTELKTQKLPFYPKIFVISTKTANLIQ